MPSSIDNAVAHPLVNSSMSQLVHPSLRIIHLLLSRQLAAADAFSILRTSVGMPATRIAA
jgi:hypothetical protein